MKNPLESLSTTVGLGVILTAIMVLIIAIFYWNTGEATAPVVSEPADSGEGTMAPEDGSSNTPETGN